MGTHQQSKDDGEGNADGIVCRGSPIYKVVLPKQQLELVPIVLWIGFVKVDGLASFLGYLMILYESLGSAAEQTVQSASACSMLGKESGRMANPSVPPMLSVQIWWCPSGQIYVALPQFGRYTLKALLGCILTDKNIP